jgi:hypothetical protein
MLDRENDVILMSELRAENAGVMPQDAENTRGTDTTFNAESALKYESNADFIAV